METTIGGRYVVYELLQPFAGGLLYTGRDTSLQRDVFLYMTDKRIADKDRFLQSIGQNSVMVNTRFLHILNAGETEEAYYVVLSAHKGKPLVESLNHLAMGPSEALNEVYELGLSLLEAMEDGVQGIVITAENLWITADNRLIIMDTWTRGKPEQCGAMGLSRLLCQLSYGNDTMPSGFAGKETLELPIFSELEPASKAQMTSLAWLGYRGEHSLAAFMLEMRGVLGTRTSNVTSGVTAGLASSATMTSPEPESKTEVFVPMRSRAESTVRPEDEASGEDEDDDDEYEYEDDDEQESWWVRNRKEVGMVVVSAVGIMLILLVWFNMPGKERVTQLPDSMTGIGQQDGDQPSTTDDGGNGSSDNGTGAGEQPVFADKDNSSSAGPDSGDETDNSEADPAEEGPDRPLVLGEEIEVPQLEGLTLEEAEQKAISMGFRYEYVIEVNREATEGTVFRQEPEAGSTFERGNRIKFYIARQP